MLNMIERTDGNASTYGFTDYHFSFLLRLPLNCKQQAAEGQQSIVKARNTFEIREIGFMLSVSLFHGKFFSRSSRLSTRFQARLINCVDSRMSIIQILTRVSMFPLV